VNVLIADDEPVSRRLLEILLRKWGYDVVVTSNGEEAWRALQNAPSPRIAILDWMMPGMDGIQVCRKIRQHEVSLTTYVLLLTAKQASEDANGKFESVADDYLPKPYAAQELKARLRTARRIIELEDQLAAAREAIGIETTHDPLTGLWNRSSLLEILRRELHRSRRHGSPVAVLMVEVDQLKHINQMYGHLTGDAVLREGVRRIRNSIRLYDSMGRYSEDQFVIISPSCDAAGALSQANRIRNTVCQDLIKTFEGDFTVTISIGIAIGGNNHQAHQLVSAADAALIEAKKAGSDHAELWRE
jgi:two-component system cell cycle response regulator